MKILISLLILASFLQSGQQIPVPIQHDFVLGYGGEFTQVLAISPKTVQASSPGWQYGTEGSYTLTFSVLNYFPNYPGKYNAEITFGTQSLCEVYGWGTARWNQVTLTCPSSNYLILAKSLPGGGPAQGADNLVLHFTVNDDSSNGGWPIIFKDVSLTFTGDTP